MKYVLIINAAPINPSSITAYRFAKTLLDKNHFLLTVFFYQDGVYHGIEENSSDLDTPNLNQWWTLLARQHQLDLCLCSAAAERRQVILGQHSAFHLASLGYLFEVCKQADKVISFG